MRYFFDTEFIESGYAKPLWLISIGIVAEDGREFYAESSGVPWDQANPWVLENVRPRLTGPIHTLDTIRTRVRGFVGSNPEFWAYYADYDWVLLCQLMGTMAQLPKGWPMWCRDLKQLGWSKGDPAWPSKPDGEHHALSDARWNRDMYDWLTDESGRGQRNGRNPA